MEPREAAPPATQEEDQGAAPPVLCRVVPRVLGACAVTDVKGR